MFTLFLCVFMDSPFLCGVFPHYIGKHWRYTVTQSRDHMLLLLAGTVSLVSKLVSWLASWLWLFSVRVSQQIVSAAAAVASSASPV